MKDLGDEGATGCGVGLHWDRRTPCLLGCKDGVRDIQGLTVGPMSMKDFGSGMPCKIAGHGNLSHVRRLPHLFDRGAGFGASDPGRNNAGSRGKRTLNERLRLGAGCAGAIYVLIFV
jgi:hypothetical protein